MHTYAGEANFNHNHYRTQDDSPITPLEVYEHLEAFYAQSIGKEFLTSEAERDDIILKYAVYWADFALDIKYVIFSGLDGGGNRIISQLKDIAMEGSLTPDEANKQLDEFFASAHGINMFKLAAKYDFTSKPEDLDALKESMKEDYRSLYNEFAPKVEWDEGLEFEPLNMSRSSSSSSRSSRSSPRDKYLAAKSQALDEIDRREFEAFASDLTKHCRSINKEQLEDLELDDFRKGLLLYHVLHTAQESYHHKPEKGIRFHEDLLTDNSIKEMLKDLPSLQLGSTEDDLGASLMTKLIEWVNNASPALEKWVEWVSINGSRGLGAEIARLREADGTIDMRQAVPKDDRAQYSDVAAIDFDKVDLRSIFLPVNDISRGGTSPEVEQLKKRIFQHLYDSIHEQRSEYKLKKQIFKAKVNVMKAALKVLSGKSNLSVLKTTLTDNPYWKDEEIPGTISKLESDIQQIFELTKLRKSTVEKGPSQTGSGPGPSKK